MNEPRTQERRRFQGGMGYDPEGEQGQRFYGEDYETSRRWDQESGWNGEGARSRGFEGRATGAGPYGGDYGFGDYSETRDFRGAEYGGYGREPREFDRDFGGQNDRFEGTFERRGYGRGYEGEGAFRRQPAFRRSQTRESGGNTEFDFGSQTGGRSDWQRGFGADFNRQGAREYTPQGGYSGGQQGAWREDAGRFAGQRGRYDDAGRFSQFGQPRREFGANGGRDFARSDSSAETTAGTGRFGYGFRDDQGEHFGKGPKGYQRSDDRICEEVCEYLTRAGELDATGIEVNVANGEVTLTGTVSSRWDKRHAEELAETVSGVKDVQNQLRTAKAGDSSRDFTAREQSHGGETASQRM